MKSCCNLSHLPGMHGMVEMLAGLKVLDLSMWQPGHVATQLFADLGADVLKVEPPGGDRERVMPDRVANYYGYKRSLVLDLKQPGDRARLLDLASQAEVVVEGYRPGVAERLGAGYDQLSAVNPALVYCSITGFGQTGPLAQSTGHEHNYQAYAGAFARLRTGPPLAAALLAGDQGAGIAAAFGILAAVLCARRTGQGEHIDVSMADLLLSWVAPMGSLGENEAQAGGEHGAPGMGVYATSDGGWVQLGIFTEDHFWQPLCRQLDLEEYSELGFTERVARYAAIEAALEDRIARCPRDELVARLEALHLPIAPVLSRPEALEHPHFWERGVMARGPNGDRRVAHPLRYRHHPARPPGLPPAIGEGGEPGFLQP